MSTTPQPPSGHGLGPDKAPVNSPRKTWVPVVMVVAALLVGVLLFNLLRAQPNYQDEEFTPDAVPPPTPAEQTS
ncbi:MAG TPA: hypothetical protein VM307_09670 [Egibacteraceae bacterium]|nr:hypothetical protein [Egibacteraceae bacterium]